jgi:colanic acid/amylovoran biosynthesis protein
MNVVVVNAYNRHNAGDAALLSALIGQVGQAFPDADITYAGLEDAHKYPQFEGTHNVGSLRRWVGEESISRRRRVGRKALTLTVFLLPRRALYWLSRRQLVGHRAEPFGELTAIARADLVVGLGGGYLNGAATLAGTMNVFFLLLPLWLATRLQRRTVLAPQSYGPFGRPVQIWLVRLCLNRVDHIVVREDPSLDQLRSCGVHEHRMQRGVDSAFAVEFDPFVPVASDDTQRHPKVGITARAWLPERAQEAYESSLGAFVDWLHESRGASVTLIPQVTSDYHDDDDRNISCRIASHCASTPKVITTPMSHVDLRALYGSLDYLVGTRFHSVIFALTAGTPALAIEYEHKTSGIMRDLGLADWVIPIREVTAARLSERFTSLETATTDYERQLKERLPDYVIRAQGFVEILRRAVR